MSRVAGTKRLTAAAPSPPHTHAPYRLPRQGLREGRGGGAWPERATSLELRPPRVFPSVSQRALHPPGRTRHNRRAEVGSMQRYARRSRRPFLGRPTSHGGHRTGVVVIAARSEAMATTTITRKEQLESPFFSPHPKCEVLVFLGTPPPHHHPPHHHPTPPPSHASSFFTHHS